MQKDNPNCIHTSMLRNAHEATLGSKTIHQLINQPLLLQRLPLYVSKFLLTMSQTHHEPLQAAPPKAKKVKTKDAAEAKVFLPHCINRIKAKDGKGHACSCDCPRSRFDQEG
jgi:hypothetical protein